MKYIKQLAIILTISLIAELMEYMIPLPIAASMYGLILMLLGLITKVIPLVIISIVSTVLIMVATGRTTQSILHAGQEKNAAAAVVEIGTESAQSVSEGGES